MFFFEAVRQGTSLVKSLCACACFLICGGPILTIVGIVILVAHNSREEDVKAYNQAVLAYDPAPVNTWVPATFGGNAATAQDETNTIYGNQEGITTVGTSRIVRAQVSASSSISFVMSNVGLFTISGISTTSTATTTLQCGYSNGCTYNYMRSRCTSSYGSDADYLGSGCSSSGSCGTCRYRTYLSEVCAVVTSESPYQRGSLSSCFYPFTSGSHRYVEDQPSNVKVTVRKADDPYIVLQRVTEGEEDFGLTKAQQQKLGAALLAVGVVLIVCVCLLVAGIFCLVRGSPHMSAPVAASPTIQMQVTPHSPQPLYPNGQPAMGQPVAYSPTAGGGYGQPAQGGYGQPQQAGGYGAPPPLATNPAYGAQPQYATGYPPQGNSYDYNNNTNTAPAGYGVPQPAYPHAQQQQQQQQQPYIQKL